MGDAVQDYSKTDSLQKITTGLAVFIAIFIIITLCICAAIIHVLIVNPPSSPTPPQPTTAGLGLPGIESYSWDDIENAAKGQTVQFWSSTADGYDQWIDQFLTPQMLALYAVNVVRVPMSESGAQMGTTQIATEKAAGNTNSGIVGLIWTNGPDYLAERSQDLLYGPFATLLPNSENFNFGSPGVAFDFGQPTEGYEFPYNAAQITFIYNPDCPGMSTPPQSMDALVTWVLANPGKFTYADPSNDYTGSAFIRHFLYEFSGGYQTFQGGYDVNLYIQKVGPAFAKLKQMIPGILKVGGQPFYAQNQTVLDNLFAVGTVCVTVSYDPEHAGEMVHVPQPPGILNFPNGTKAYLPATGTIGNVNYVAISFNAKSLFGALVTTNFIGSMGAQYSRRQITPPGIGALQTYDPNCEAIEEGGWSIPFALTPDYPETPSHAALLAAFMPEIDSNYANQMQTDWLLCVAQNLTTATGNTAYGPGSGAPCS